MRSAFTFSRGDGGLAIMVADMQRLENAARLAMGDYDGPMLLPRPPAHPLHLMLRPATLALIAAVAGLLAISLF